jgi:putative transposase
VRRQAVRHLRASFPISERHACRLVGVGRSTLRYQSRARDEIAIRTRLRELAAERRRFGYRRLQVLLRREGIVVNHKRVLRLYRDEGLTMRRRKRKRVAYGRAQSPLVVVGPNQRWALDFVSDALAWGRRIRLLAVIDVFTRECLAIEVDTSLPAERVSRVLDRIVAERGAGEDVDHGQ